VKGALRIPVDAIASGLVVLSRDAATYATRVHRLGPGDAIVVFDSDSAIEADATIVALDRRGVTAQVGAPRRASRVPARQITLLQGIGKGDKLDAIVRDATELGATRVVPVVCERSVARPPHGRAARWRKIAVQAARQCGRGDAPVIAAPMLFADAVRDVPAAALRVCLDPEAPRTLGAALVGLGSAGVVFAVGPEGGLSPTEVTIAESAGFTRASLGPLVLRTETVCAAVLGALLVWPGVPSASP